MGNALASSLVKVVDALRSQSLYHVICIGYYGLIRRSSDPFRLPNAPELGSARRIGQRSEEGDRLTQAEKASGVV